MQIEIKKKEKKEIKTKGKKGSKETIFKKPVVHESVMKESFPKPRGCDCKSLLMLNNDDDVFVFFTQLVASSTTWILLSKFKPSRSLSIELCCLFVCI